MQQELEQMIRKGKELKTRTCMWGCLKSHNEHTSLLFEIRLFLGNSLQLIKDKVSYEQFDILDELIFLGNELEDFYQSVKVVYRESEFQR